jgi:hypothetical protein
MNLKYTYEYNISLSMVCVREMTRISHFIWDGVEGFPSMFSLIKQISVCLCVIRN